MKCLHTQIHIREEVLTAQFHDREHDGTWSHAEPMSGDLTGAIHVKCDTCGLDKRYHRLHEKPFPAWLVERLEECLPF